MKSMTTAAESEATSLPLVGQQTLVIENDARGNRLRILDPHGQVTLSVEVAEAGRPVLRFDSGLQIRTEGHLEFEAQGVAIRGRDEVRIESGADAHIHAAGNLNLKGNGDVELQGKQVRVN
ncbi:hypothetical protein [Candidatus Thiosymbion oneisti]|uniref:hypothetical protein n=1 Tax=Candidatus Thiosymbion oneisti TaxID=589554 RepID=UPI0010610448|nr:hypothetical protein [Candidatus Thiosymbion oneisti]